MLLRRALTLPADLPYLALIAATAAVELVARETGAMAGRALRVIFEGALALALNLRITVHAPWAAAAGTLLVVAALATG